MLWFKIKYDIYSMSPLLFLYSRVISMEVVANKEVLVAEKEVMVEARGFDKEWEETHVVKLR